MRVSSSLTTAVVTLRQLRTLAGFEDGKGNPGYTRGDELGDGGEDVEDAEVDACCFTRGGVWVFGGGGGVLRVVCGGLVGIC